MLISIIVPVFNVEKYLLRCLDSLNNQLYKDIEIVLIDDGSTDKSAAIIDNYTFKNAKKTVIHQKNCGVISAWRNGIKKSSGDYIGFVDSDDYIDTNMFEEMVCAAARTNADIVMCKHFYENNGTFQESMSPLKEGFYEGDNYKSLLNLTIPKLNSNYISPSRINKIIKREIIIKSLDSFIDSVSSGDDNYCTSKWFMDSSSIYFIDKCLYYYCNNPESISHSYKEKILDSYEVMIEDIIKYNKTKNLMDKNQLNNLFNFYGFVWCLYVFNSNLSKKKKKQEIKKMCIRKCFKKALKYTEPGHVARKILYKLSIITNNPFFILFGLKHKGKQN